MRKKCISSSSRELKKLIQLYEMRQEKARKAYQKQQALFLQANEKLERRKNEFEVIKQEKQDLQRIGNSDEYASDLRIQQHISIKRRWLKYDFDKAQYFLNDAQEDSDIEKKEADALRSQWMQMRAKVENLQEQLSLSIKQDALVAEAREELAQEDENLSRKIILANAARANRSTKHNSLGKGRQCNG